ncbi:MAG TPA: type IV toxin-antitoxin system AbiEi family antitoxin domain-containing protein [Burkholderiaceae bacterium]|nr:type IV toxin-antitoxin system AbiEi family antitoxin domain-containing protein [Burkholderiaceae bacterium]
MTGTSRHNLIKRVQSDLPRGAPFDLDTLGELGVSPKLAADYAKNGWLVRLAQGVYAFPNDNFNVYGALLFLQRHVTGLHIGGKSALTLHGIRHNLGRDTLVLWGDTRYALPTWFTSRFPARYVYASLFNWPDTKLPTKTLGTPPGLPDHLCVAVAERAVLEMLYDVGTRQSLEEARNLFDGLHSPRKELLGQLLACCTSVKTVRLFLRWARETGVVDVDDLLARYPIHTGSSKRWVSRLPDGSLLSLKPHG